jgi:hypothetical protein
MRFQAVNPIKAHSVLGSVLEYGNCIAVCYGNYFAGDNELGVGGGCGCEEDGDYYEDENAFVHGTILQQTKLPAQQFQFGCVVKIH